MAKRGTAGAQGGRRTGKNWLTAAEARNAKPGKHADGGGLYLMVNSPTQRMWLFRYMIAGKSHDLGFGSALQIPLAEAREKADAARKLIARGVDPLAHRRAEKVMQIVEAEAGTTFAEAAAQYITAHEAGWRNPIHRLQWRNTLATYAEPIIGALPVGEIATQHVLEILQPIWTDRPETASRLRGRIEMILSYAMARGWRDGPNPAVWRGHLQLMLPAKSKVHQVKHHAALDWHEGYAFMKALRARDSLGARALEFAILTAARSGEVRGARWAEIDLDAAIWTVPPERMKGKRAHRVPLSAPALALLRAMAELKDGSGLVFIGQKQDVPMSDMTLGAVLRRMGRGDLTAHGFRSTFCDWAAEATAYPPHVVEAALAHVVADKVEAAYRRGDLFAKRQTLMADWAAYLERAPAEVVELRPGQRQAIAEASAPAAG